MCPSLLRNRSISFIGKLKCLLFLITGSAMMSMSAPGAVLITASGSAPFPSDVALSINAAGDVYRTKYDSVTPPSRRDTGQTFKASDVSGLQLTGVVYQVGSNPTTSIGAGAKGASITISLFEFADGTSVTPVGTAIFTGVGVLPVTIDVNDYLRFDFGQVINLDPEKYYGIQLGFNNASGTTYIDFVRGTSSTYENGRAFRVENEVLAGPPSLYTGMSYDFKMALIGIPEPSVVGLTAVVGVGCLASQWRLRRRSVRKRS